MSGTIEPGVQWYTVEPVFSYPTPVPQTYYYPTGQPDYYYPTPTPYSYQQEYFYPTATPFIYQEQYIYPTAASENPSQPFEIYQSPTPEPTQDHAAMLGFTYKLESMTENNIPMTWHYTGLSEFAINYLDAFGNISPESAMAWTPAAELCTASECNASVSVPDDLLRQGRFSLQLLAKDASGTIYVSEAVEMEVSITQPTATPEPVQPKSVFTGFLEWLWSSILNLFRGK